MATTIYNNISSSRTIESWFMPFDILSITCLTVVVALSSFFLLIILLDRTCHTVPMMLVANSCLAALLCAGDILWITIIALINDLKRNDQQDILCIFRGYLTYVSCAVLNYSFLLQAFYRFVTVVYPMRLFWRSQRSQILIVSLTWIYAFLFPMPFMFTGQIILNLDNQICQFPLRLSFTMIFTALSLYMSPMGLIMFIYYKLVRYIHKMNQRVIPVNTLVRAQLELQMVRRTVILLMIIITIDFPYALFLFISFFSSPPQYHFRIAYIFINFAVGLVMIALFQFTDPLKRAIMKKFYIQSDTIVPAAP